MLINIQFWFNIIKEMKVKVLLGYNFIFIKMKKLKY